MSDTPPFDLRKTSYELENWITSVQPRPCAVEYRFMHGNVHVGVWIADESGKALIPEMVRRLKNKVHPNTNPSIVRAMYDSKFTEKNADHWIDGLGAPLNLAEDSQDWESVSDQSCWSWRASLQSMNKNKLKVLNIECATKMHEATLPLGMTMLVVGAPAQAMKVSTEVEDIVILQLLWKDSVPCKLRDPIRDSVFRKLVFLTTEALNTPQMEWENVRQNVGELFTSPVHEVNDWKDEHGNWTCPDRITALESHIGSLERMLGAICGGTIELADANLWPSIGKATNRSRVHLALIAAILKQDPCPNSTNKAVVLDRHAASIPAEKIVEFLASIHALNSTLVPGKHGGVSTAKVEALNDFFTITITFTPSNATASAAGIARATWDPDVLCSPSNKVLTWALGTIGSVVTSECLHRELSLKEDDLKLGLGFRVEEI